MKVESKNYPEFIITKNYTTTGLHFLISVLYT